MGVNLKAGMLAAVMALAAGEGFAGAIEADGRDRVCRPHNMAARNTVVTRWNERALEAICIGRPMPTIVSRELFLLHAAIYDAWAAFDPVAKPIYAPSGLQQSAGRELRVKRRPGAEAPGLGLTAYVEARGLQPLRLWRSGTLTTIWKG